MKKIISAILTLVLVLGIFTPVNLHANDPINRIMTLIHSLLETAASDTTFDLIHYSQNDPRWADMMFGSFTMAQGGCGPTALAMVASTLSGTEVLPSYVATWGSRFYTEGVGVSHALFTGASTHNHFGLNYQALNIYSDYAILEALRGGAKIITSVQSSTGSNAREGNRGIFNPSGLGGHIVVIHGVTPYGNVFVTSPRYDFSENTEGWPLDVVRQELHRGINIFWTYTAQ